MVTNGGRKMGNANEFIGLSGCQFRIKNTPTLIKYATGDTIRMRELKEQAHVMSEKYATNCFYPIKIVKPINLLATKDLVEFEMEFVDNTHNEDLIHEKIEEYFDAVSKSGDGHYRNFKYWIDPVLQDLPDSSLKAKFMENLEIPDEILLGECHGEMGFRNFVSSENYVYTFDLRKPFINSPLHDIATLKLSANTEKEIKLVEKIIEKFSTYRKQIDIIKKIRVLEFYKDTNREETKLFHEELFFK